MQRSRNSAEGGTTGRRGGKSQADPAKPPAMLSARLGRRAAASRRQVKQARGLSDQQLVIGSLDIYRRLHELMGRPGGGLVRGRFSLQIRDQKDGSEKTAQFP